MPPTASGDIRLGPVSGLELGRQPSGGSPPQAGQYYRARVERVEDDGSVLLQLGGQTLRLAAGMNLAVGQLLVLRMTSTLGGPKFTVVRTLPASRDRMRSGAAGDSVVGDLQVMASRQQSLGNLLAWLAEPDGKSLESAVATLLNSLSSPGELAQPDRLKGAMHDSGLLLEPRLAAATADPALFPAAVRGDFKLLLWRLLGQAGGELDGGLEDILEGLLAHISLRQLRAIRQAEDGHFFWSLELPLAWGQRLLPVTITLRREGGLLSLAHSDANSWEIEISLDSEHLGMFHAHLFLRGHQLSVSLEAEQPGAVTALRAELSALREALSLQGFDVETVVSRPIECDVTGSGAAAFREISALGREP